jgi:hypothetical protein
MAVGAVRARSCTAAAQYVQYIETMSLKRQREPEPIAAKVLAGEDELAALKQVQDFSQSYLATCVK